MAAPDVVDICNMALSHIGSSKFIAALSEANTQARQCNLWYDQCLREILEAHNWTFARKRVELADHSEDPPDEWAYRFQYPADCLKLRKIVDPSSTNVDDSGVPFQVEFADDGTQSVLVQVDEPIAVYTFEQTNPAVFPALFVTALSYLLASKFPVALSGSKSTQRNMAQAYIAALHLAQGSNAQEQRNDDPPDADWITARA